MEKIIKNAVETLKNNLNFNRQPYKQKYRDKEYREFMIGIYNRFDELGLIFSSLKNISFNNAIKELELEGYMEELKTTLKETKTK